CIQIAQGEQRCGKVQFHKITGNRRLGQKLPESRIMWRGRASFTFHVTCPDDWRAEYHDQKKRGVSKR
ncbi:hypothetical protein XB02_19405, partial [Pantoea ananatis]